MDIKDYTKALLEKLSPEWQNFLKPFDGMEDIVRKLYDIRSEYRFQPKISESIMALGNINSKLIVFGKPFSPVRNAINIYYPMNTKINGGIDNSIFEAIWKPFYDFLFAELATKNVEYVLATYDLKDNKYIQPYNKVITDGIGNDETTWEYEGIVHNREIEEFYKVTGTLWKPSLVFIHEQTKESYEW